MNEPAIVLTGPDGDESLLAQGLRRLGADVHHLPLLEVAPPADRGPLLDAARRFSLYDAVVFTSPRGVAALAAALAELGIANREKEALTVGPATSTRADEAGFLVVVEGGDDSGPGAAGLLEVVDREKYPVAGRRLLLPVSERAKSELADGLRSRGAKLDAVPAYTVRPVSNPAERVAGLHRTIRLRDDFPPPLLVASPSAAEVLAAVSGSGYREIPRLVAIGPTTAAAMRELALRVDAVADAPTPEGIIAALMEVGGARS